MLRILLIIGSATRLLAQDITVGAPSAFPPDTAGQTIVLKKNIAIRYPTELIKMPEPGYVIVFVMPIPGGDEGWGATGTHEPFRREVDAAWKKNNLRLADGKGKMPEAPVYVLVIFNPRTAAVDLPNATPRLLLVKPL